MFLPVVLLFGQICGPSALEYRINFPGVVQQVQYVSAKFPNGLLTEVPVVNGYSPQIIFNYCNGVEIRNCYYSNGDVYSGGIINYRNLKDVPIKTSTFPVPQKTTPIPAPKMSLKPAVVPKPTLNEPVEAPINKRLQHKSVSSIPSPGFNKQSVDDVQTNQIPIIPTYEKSKIVE
jgi:hypothetical protein